MATKEFELLYNALSTHGYQPKIIGNGKGVSMCPAHPDSPDSPNLSFDDRTIKVVVRCRSRDCEDGAITEAVGLHYLQLYYDDRYEKYLKLQEKKSKKSKSDNKFILSNGKKKKEKSAENESIYIENPYSSKIDYDHLAHYAEHQGSTEEDFKKAGWKNDNYRVKKEINGEVQEMLLPSISYNTDSGIVHRLLKLCDIKQYGKYRRQANAKQCFYKYYEALEMASRQKVYPIMVNGDPGTVISQSRGLPCFNLCAGESSNIEDFLIDDLDLLFKDYNLEKNLFMLLDNDSSGKNGALLRKATLEKAGFHVTVFLWKNNYKGYDIANFCKEYINATPDRLYSLIMELYPYYPPEIINKNIKNINGEEQKNNQLNLPTIVVNRQLIDILPESINIIAAMNKPPTMFRQTNRLVRINEIIKENSFIIEDIDDNIINGILFRGAQWVKENKDGTDKPVYPPIPIVKDILVNPPNIIPELETIITAPAFTEEGVLFNQAGYNAKLKVFYPSSKIVNFEPINPKPTENEVSECLDFLKNDLLGDFPLETQSDFANTLGTILEQFIKFQIYGCRPLRAFEAATPGTGKGLLVRAICLLCFGREIEATTIPEEKQEWAKLITSLLMEMPEAIFFDNVGKIILSPDLEAVLTAILWKRRLLGTNKTVECYNRALWMVTGNNIIYGGDLPRRVVPIRMVANQEDPSKRPASDFRHPDLLGWINTNRGLLVRACLTLVQYWINQGQPLSNYRLGSFESWSTNIGGLLNCLGVKGFLDNLETSHKISDPNREYWIEFIKQWYQEFQLQEVTVKQLLELCEQKELFTFAKDHESSNKSKQTKLGAMLRNYRSRIFNNYKIVYKTERDHSLYCLEYIEPK